MRMELVTANLLLNRMGYKLLNEVGIIYNIEYILLEWKMPRALFSGKFCSILLAHLAEGSTSFFIVCLSIRPV